MKKPENHKRLLQSENMLVETGVDPKINPGIDLKVEAEINLKVKAEIDPLAAFKELPLLETFAPSSVYAVYNRKTQRESKINGVQLESLLGLFFELRDKLKRREIAEFDLGEYHVRFVKG